MRYVSDDGKFFDTAKECLEHENREKKRIEEERIKKEKLERDRKNRLKAINMAYEELQNLISEYGNDYGTNHDVYFSPFNDFINNIFGV